MRKLGFVLGGLGFVATLALGLFGFFAALATGNAFWFLLAVPFCVVLAATV